MAAPRSWESEAAMSTISPKVRSQFDSLSPSLQNAILSKNVSINTLYDLIGVLDEIIREAEEQ